MTKETCVTPLCNKPVYAKKKQLCSKHHHAEWVAVNHDRNLQNKQRWFEKNKDRIYQERKESAK